MWVSFEAIAFSIAEIFSGLLVFDWGPVKFFSWAHES